MNIVSPVVASTFKDLKDYNEVLLARELYDYLARDTEFMKRLREVVHLGVKYLVRLYAEVKDNKTVNPLFRRAVQKEFRLEMWGSGVGEQTPIEIYVNKLRAFEKKPSKLTPNFCSELLRLFGGVIEDVAKGHERANPAIVAGGKTFPDVATLNSMRAAYRDMIFGTREKERTRLQVGHVDPFSKDVRKRWQVWTQGQKVERVEASRKKSEEMKQAGFSLRGLSDEQAKYVMRGKSANKVRGMTLWQLKEGSTVWAIDRIFGLPPGADISGTTADMMFGLEMLANIRFPPTFGGSGGRPEVLPLLYLLPVAAMVSHYHHTILECAMTQTLNGEIDYAVGFYTSLIPKACMKSQSPRVKEIRTLLQKWEDHPTNFKAIFVEEWNGTWAYLFTTRREVDAFRSFATVTYDRYEKVFAPLRKKKQIGTKDIQSIVTGLISDTTSFSPQRRTFWKSVDEAWSARQRFYGAMNQL